MARNNESKRQRSAWTGRPTADLAECNLNENEAESRVRFDSNVVFLHEARSSLGPELSDSTNRINPGGRQPHSLVLVEPDQTLRKRRNRIVLKGTLSGCRELSFSRFQEAVSEQEEIIWPGERTSHSLELVAPPPQRVRKTRLRKIVSRLASSCSRD